MTETKIVSINESVIELHRLLKLAGFAASGGEAKTLIAVGKVLLNNVRETRKRKKVRPGDTVTVGSSVARVVSANDATQT